MSWREADDSRCPECGGKISSTASYCMHCHADLPADGEPTAESSSADTVLADDEFGGPDDGQMPSKQRRESNSAGDGVADSLDKFGRDSGARHRLDGFAARIASMIWTDVPEPGGGGVPDHEFTAPLWMRLPIGIVAGLFVYTIFLVTIMFLLDGVPLVPGLAALVGFFAIPLWLIRKPLPSDIVGDACYGIGLLLVSMPPAFVVHELVAILLGTSDGSPGETVLLGVFGLLAMAMPAALFFVVGCVGNRYARSKLDSKAEEATDPTNV